MEPKGRLPRTLGLLSATALVVSNMIGTGIFTGTGFLAAQLGSPDLIFAIYLVGGVCAFVGAMCYSELGANFPRSGGEYVYLTEAFGPAWGFMTGWASFFAGFSAPIAAAALAFAEYVAHFATLSPSMRVVLACALVAAFSVLNVFGVERSAKVQNALTITKVAVLIAFVVFGFAAGSGNTANFSQTTTRDTSIPIAAQFALSLVWVYVAYSGWNAATYVAEELREPARTLPWALGIGTVLVTILYLALNAAFIYATPLEAMKNIPAIGSFAAEHLFGATGAGIFAGLMAVSLMSKVNAMVTIGPRVYFAMAHDGAFPKIAARVHPKFQTPAVAIIAQGACTMLMTLTSFPDLVLYIGMTLNVFTAMSVISILFLRKRAGWRRVGAVNFLYPAMPVLFAAVGLWMTYQGIMLRPDIAIATFATLAAGALFYHFRRRSKHSA